MDQPIIDVEQSAIATVVLVNRVRQAFLSRGWKNIEDKIFQNYLEVSAKMFHQFLIQDKDGSSLNARQAALGIAVDNLAALLDRKLRKTDDLPQSKLDEHIKPAMIITDAQEQLNLMLMIESSSPDQDLAITLTHNQAIVPPRPDPEPAYTGPMGFESAGDKVMRGRITK